MTTRESWGAVLRTHSSIQISRSFLDQYLVLQKIKKDSTEDKVINGHEDYVAALGRHFSRLDNFLQDPNESIVNLVFGNVQSGKTGHLLANICWARDNNFHLAIVLTGSNTDLGEQTVERLKTKLPANTSHIMPSPTESRLATGPTLDTLQEYVYNRLAELNKPIPVVTLIKSPARLAAVRVMIEELNARIQLPLNIIILDDEADQASVDPTASSKELYVSDVSLIDDSATRTTIHNRINEIRDRINGKHIYLAYTATPQALFHGELYGPLQPEFCSVLPVGEQYTSIGDIVRNGKILVNIDNNSKKVTSNENLATMEFCFIQFLILSWLHKYHPNTFHEKNLESSHECEQSSIQFLIHPSGRNADHKIYKENIDSCVRDFKKNMESPSDREQFIQGFFEPAYLQTIKNFTLEEQTFFNDDKQLINCWDFILSLLDDSNRLKIKLVNYKQRRELSNQGISEPLVPIKPEQWNDGADAWVLIGGDILGRGLSIPHLVVTLFLRNPNEPLFDTSVQQMRFCGYRKDYLRVLRVYANSDIVQDYIDAVLIDEPFRNRALRWDIENRNLINRPPIFRFIAPSDSRFRPTRNNVLSGEIVKRNTTSSSGFFSLEKIANPKKFIRNYDFVKDFLKDLSIFDKYKVRESDSKSDATVYSLTYEDARNLNRNWNVESGEELEFNALIELMGYPASEKGLAELNFLFSVDTTIGQYNSGGDIHRDYNNIDGLPVRSLNDECNQDDWSSFQNLDKFSNLSASLVGGSERAMQLHYPDSVLIQCRLYKILNPNPEGFIEKSRNPEGRGIGLGLSLIGWIPDSKSEFYVNKEAARIYAS
jgi:hypothetical protein